MTGDSKPQSVEHGPATVTCPYCGEELEVEAGPTKLCEVTHCEEDEWIIVDLITEKAGTVSRFGGDG